MRKLLIVATIALCPNAALAQAQTNQSVAWSLVKAGLAVMAKMPCGAQRCAPTTAGETGNAPVKVREAVALINAGKEAAVAQWCGVEGSEALWASVSAPMFSMPETTERRIVLARILFEMGREEVTGRRPANAECPAEARDRQRELIASLSK